MRTLVHHLSVLTVCLAVSLTALALVPPRDLSRFEEWQAQQALQAPQGLNRAPLATQAIGRPELIPRILVIAVSFSDFPFTTNIADVDSMFNGQDWTKDDATGSVRQYFHDQSMGIYTPQFDVVGPVTLSQGYAYYGKGANVGGSKVGYMVTEACALVDDSVDFSLYDADNNGRVDLVFILYAGFGENDQANSYAQSVIPNWTDLVWPAYWDVVSAGYGSNPIYFDGKYIYACEFSNELDALYTTATRNVPAGIGVLCHEFGHALGLPDFYATSEATHKTLGAWDVMCYGLYNNDTHTPPSFTAYERFYMGWMTPTLITEPDTLTLEHIATSNQAYMIVEGDTHNMSGLAPAPATFYLLENRLQTGWDLDVPGEGMLITRISYDESKWKNNKINNTAGNQGVDIMEADGLTPSTNTAEGAWGKPGDAFPAGASSYEAIPEHAITDITLNNGIIQFVYRGGVQPSDPTDHPALTDSLRAYKTVRNGQLLINAQGHTFTPLGLPYDY